MTAAPITTAEQINAVCEKWKLNQPTFAGEVYNIHKYDLLALLEGCTRLTAAESSRDSLRERLEIAVEALKYLCTCDGTLDGKSIDYHGCDEPCACDRSNEALEQISAIAAKEGEGEK